MIYGIAGGGGGDGGEMVGLTTHFAFQNLEKFHLRYNQHGWRKLQETAPLSAQFIDDILDPH